MAHPTIQHARDLLASVDPDTQDVRTLLGFAMPIPKAVATLEADFLPVFLTEIKAHAGLQAGEMRVSDLVTRLSAPAAVNFLVANGGGGGHPPTKTLINALVFAGVLVLVLVTHK